MIAFFRVPQIHLHNFPRAMEIPHAHQRQHDDTAAVDDDNVDDIIVLSVTTWPSQEIY